MNCEKEKEEFEKLLKIKNDDYYNKHYKHKKNIDKTMKLILKDLFLEVGQLYVRFNILFECLKKYKENRNKISEKNKVDVYLEKINKLCASFDLAIATFEEIVTEIFSVDEI